MKGIVLSEKKLVSLFCCAVLLAAAAVLTLHGVLAAMTSAEAGLYPIRCVQTQEKKIALTFDADTDNLETQKLIEILRRYHVKSTFFVVGAWVGKYPESLQALTAAGHEIGNHSNTHPHMTGRSRADMAAQMADCSRRIETAAGVRPKFFRAPYGDTGPEVVAAAQSLGMVSVEWSVDSFDWRNLPPGQIARRVIDQARPGAIVLLHCGAKNTATALPEILETLQAEGYQIVPVSLLLYQDHFIVTESGVQVRTD